MSAWDNACRAIDKNNCDNSTEDEACECLACVCTYALVAERQRAEAAERRLVKLEALCAKLGEALLEMTAAAARNAIERDTALDKLTALGMPKTNSTERTNS